jgi:hypothetical protein
MDIKPGATVSVEISVPPKSEAARKTLVRICRKDARVAKHQRRLKAKRPSWQTWRRGGKMWHHQMRSRANVRLEAGARYTVHATVDVIRDLKSVARWVNVTTG